jgi:hypothetical protein
MGICLVLAEGLERLNNDKLTLDDADRLLCNLASMTDAAVAEECEQAVQSLLNASKLMWDFYEDLSRSNPGFLGRLVLQDYKRYTAAIAMMPVALKAMEVRENLVKHYGRDAEKVEQVKNEAKAQENEPKPAA